MNQPAESSPRETLLLFGDYDHFSPSTVQRLFVGDEAYQIYVAGKQARDISDIRDLRKPPATPLTTALAGLGAAILQQAGTAIFVEIFASLYPTIDQLQRLIRQAGCEAGWPNVEWHGIEPSQTLRMLAEALHSAQSITFHPQPDAMPRHGAFGRTSPLAAELFASTENFADWCGSLSSGLHHLFCSLDGEEAQIVLHGRKHRIISLQRFAACLATRGLVVEITDLATLRHHDGKCFGYVELLTTERSLSVSPQYVEMRQSLAQHLPKALLTHTPESALAAIAGSTPAPASFAATSPRLNPLDFSAQETLMALRLEAAKSRNN